MGEGRRVGEGDLKPKGVGQDTFNFLSAISMNEKVSVQSRKCLFTSPHLFSRKLLNKIPFIREYFSIMNLVFYI